VEEEEEDDDDEEEDDEEDDEEDYEEDDEEEVKYSRYEVRWESVGGVASGVECEGALVC
jgi:hypothetical protein